ncbi:MAG: tRNA modification GTPase [Planctomycetaceae bacterium]|nr:tRNA modification GTPase [Planctomycetaceae bacterium]
MNSVDDTIAAPASPPGPGLRSIIRVSGPQTRPILRRCFEPDDLASWDSKSGARRVCGVIQVPDWRSAIPATAMLWPGQRSYTGGETAELHLPGSPPLVDAVLAQLYSAGARPARAGEFTLRAFLAGRLDLVQAEAVLGVIDADDHTQLRTALEQLAGGLSGKIGRVREELLLHLADLEAGLDFVEEDIEFVGRPELRRRLVKAVGWLSELQHQTQRRMTSGSRRDVVLAGLPNAGKSTLFNRLLTREAAIVSSERGTTRDVLRAELDLDGVAITLWDTAGWEEAISSVDVAAGAIRQDRLARADLVVWCTAADLCSGDRLLDRTLREQAAAVASLMPVLTKVDLPTSDRSSEEAVEVSAATGEGLADLLRSIRAALGGGTIHQGEWLTSTTARCRESLRQGQSALADALNALDAGAGDELIALDLRAGLDALGMICGSVYTDDVLDRIFSRFCIGK